MPGLGGPLLDDDVARLIDGGAAVIAATRNAGLRPALTRAWGPEASEDGRSLRLCLGVRAGDEVAANLADNGALAVTFALPTTYRSVQVKGVVSEVGAPTTADLAGVEAHADAFARETVRMGLQAVRTRALRETELLAVRLDVREVYDQTPGPRAGTAR